LPVEVVVEMVVLVLVVIELMYQDRVLEVVGVQNHL
tara:strand:+ start:229 stop:336 length:108 start_codon:yes stop_codon:yes gene_type:complete